jgi:hypothetical protein
MFAYEIFGGGGESGGIILLEKAPRPTTPGRVGYHHRCLVLGSEGTKTAMPDGVADKSFGIAALKRLAFGVIQLCLLPIR